MRLVDTFSVFKINNDKEFGFLPEKYSKFKFGSLSTAREFGHLLAHGFIEEKLKKQYNGERIVLVPSAYSHIPTASYYLTMNFKDILNSYLHKNGYPIAEETKIHRTVSYREDYGEMSAEDRYKLICGDTFYIDKKYVEGKILIFVDDVKITGTHEKIIEKMLNDLKIDNQSYMLYFAELVNPAIPPNIENYLNFYSIKRLEDVNSLIENNDFIPNTRVVKFILGSNPTEFDSFITNQTTDFIHNLYYAAIGNEYFKFEAYNRNLAELEQLIIS